MLKPASLIVPSEIKKLELLISLIKELAIVMTQMNIYKYLWMMGLDL